MGATSCVMEKSAVIKQDWSLPHASGPGALVGRRGELESRSGGARRKPTVVPVMSTATPSRP